MGSEDPRIVVEQGIDARVAAIAEPIIEDLGFRLVRVRFSGLNGGTLQVMAERADGTMDVAGCETVSRALSPALDAEDPIGRAYSLEVSSPGIDRPLVRRSDFDSWAGHVAKIELSVLFEGRKRFRGILLGAESDCVALRPSETAEGEPETVNLPIEAIADARLALSDELIKAALKGEKARRADGGSH